MSKEEEDEKGDETDDAEQDDETDGREEEQGGDKADGIESRTRRRPKRKSGR